jgi:hypothetical protein
MSGLPFKLAPFDVHKYIVSIADLEGCPMHGLLCKHYDTIDKLLKVSLDDVLLHKSDNVQLIECKIMARFAKYLQSREGMIRTFLQVEVSETDWKGLLDKNDFAQYVKENSPYSEAEVLQMANMRAEIANSAHSSMLLASNFRYKVTDYPEYSGDMSDWLAWRLQFKSMCDLDGLGAILDETDEVHMARMSENADYKSKTVYLYNIIVNRTVKNYPSAIFLLRGKKDGRLLYNAMVDLREGSVYTRREACRERLRDLRLERDSPGGFAAYHKQLTHDLYLLEEMGHPMSEHEKLSVLQMTIKDNAYEMTFETCEGKPFDFHLYMLRNRARRLAKENAKNSKALKSSGGGGALTPVTLRVSDDVWRQMTREQKDDHIRQARAIKMNRKRSRMN